MGCPSCRVFETCRPGETWPDLKSNFVTPHTAQALNRRNLVATVVVGVLQRRVPGLQLVRRVLHIYAFAISVHQCWNRPITPPCAAPTANATACLCIPASRWPRNSCKRVSEVSRGLPCSQLRRGLSQGLKDPTTRAPHCGNRPEIDNSRKWSELDSGLN